VADVRKALWGLVPDSNGEPGKKNRITYKSQSEIKKMREGGYLLSSILAELRDAVRPGVNTLDLDNIARERVERAGDQLSFLNYRGYPAGICASINCEVVHGIPAESRIVEEGDVLKLDLGVRHKGFHVDSALTVAVGKVAPEVEKLMTVTEDSLWVGIRQVRAGKRLNDVCGSIQRYVEGHGFSVVQNMVGHGVGKHLHEEPQIPNYVTPEMPNPLLQEGMTLAIEPMTAIGQGEIEILGDSWTVVTKDRTVSAHYEHTVLVTKNGFDILTLGPHDSGR
jgi:methionyl aminopeptidase